MTVSSATARNSYAGAGTTGPFTVSFYFLANSHLQVVRTSSAGVETTLVLNTDYTVTGAGNPAGGSITTTVAVVVGETLTITRNVPLTQETDYSDNDPFPASTHETALDKLTMIAQQIFTNVSRVLTLRTGDTDGSGAYNAKGNRITGLGAPVETTDAVRKTELDAAAIAAGNVPSPTSGQVGYLLQATGTATFAWQAPSGVADNSITNAKLADMATQTIKTRKSGGTGDPEDGTISDVLDFLTTGRGSIPVRGASSWGRVSIGVAGRFLRSDGTDPSWAAIGIADLPVGTIVDFAYNEYTTAGIVTAIIPYDDTIPQVGEGTQILTAAITPKDTTNRIRVRVIVNAGRVAGGAPEMIVAAFVNGAANAVAAVVGNLGDAAGSAYPGQTVLEYEYVPGSTSAQTVTIRVGNSSISGVYVNGANAGRKLGGVSRCTLVLEEIAA